MNLCIQFIIPFNNQPTSPPAEPEVKLAGCKGGFPHSEITGSKGARASPVLIAACHVLHRLSMPRHPLEALIRLIVLSKTHALLLPFQYARLGKPHLSENASVLFICQIMMSSQVQPGQTLTCAAEPFIHDVKACTSRS